MLLILWRHIAQMVTELHKNGKLLLTGEYAVLDGALALAIPTRFGQKFNIEQHHASEKLVWQAYDHHNMLWFEAELNMASGKILATSNNDSALALLKILDAAIKLNPDFMADTQGVTIKSHLEFPRKWGLGSSSTLIAAIAQWSKTDPYSLSGMSFGGSGYDVTAANMTQPFIYKIEQRNPQVNPVTLDWPFRDDLFFVHRNQKQNSRESIKHYRNKETSAQWIQDLGALTKAMIAAQSAEEFADLMQQHERIIAETLGLNPIKEELFDDFPGAIKSLGGWGGDFILALNHQTDRGSKTNQTRSQTLEYFKEKGYHTVIPYQEMILAP